MLKKQLFILTEAKTHAEINKQLFNVCFIFYAGGFMPENFLSFNDVSYVLPDGETLFSGISFDIARGEKAALTGANGIGKTTLFRLAEQVLLPSGGSIVCGEPPAFLPQDIEIGQTVGAALGIRDILDAVEKVNAGNCSAELFDLIGSRWNIRSETAAALADFGLSHIDLSASFASLSGGEREKILLLNVFLSDSGILMFDEPTNNLDTQARKVFYDYIRKTPKTVFIISHDRDLLERMNCIFELSADGLKKYGGNYGFYRKIKSGEKEKLKEQKRHIESEAGRLIESRIRIENSIGKQSRRAQKQIQSRRYLKIQANEMGSAAQETVAKKIKKIEEKLTRRQNELYQVKLSLKEDAIKIPLPAKPFLKDKVIDISDMSFAYSGHFLFRHFNLTVKGGEKIRIDGCNGSGKTTLIRLILGLLKPNGGRITLNGRAVYLSQDLSLLSGNKTVLDNIIDFNPGISNNEAYAVAANFRFRNKDALKTVKNLSGGEKLKAALAAVLGTKNQPDILILDEPTNNLDIRSTEILENALHGYQGTAVIISHDRIFIENISVDRTIHLDPIET